MKKQFIFSGLLFMLLLSFGVYGQNKSNKGREFWLGYGHNILFTFPEPPVGINSQTMVLYLSTEQAATVTVSVNSTGFTQTVNIPANTVDFSVIIPKTGANDARLIAEGLSTKGIHILSDVPIVAYAHEYGTLSSGATMLMPIETYGYTYYSLNYTQTSNYPNSLSWFYVVASEDNTRLEITPSDSTEGGWEPNLTYTVNLNKGEIYNVFGKQTGNLRGKDMTGSKIVSVPGNDANCHPVGVFSGSSRNVLLSPSCNGSGANTGISNGNGGEFMMQQIFPANAWGTKYVTYHTVNNVAGNILTPFLNIYRVAVRDPSTVVRRNGIVMTGLVNNFYYEFTSTSGDFIEADKPILVAQYTVSSNECVNYGANPLGDPEMIYLSPIEQGVKSALFYNTRNQAISLSFVNIIVPITAVPSLLIDGTPVLATEFITHPTNSNYAVVVKRLFGAAAQHSITCDSTFIATNYGVGVTESYGYNVGTLVNNLNAYGNIKNTYSPPATVDSFTCRNTPLRFFIKVAYPITNIHWKLSQVPGLSPNTDSFIANPIPVAVGPVNGRTYYTYTLDQDFTLSNAGTFYLPVTYTSPGIDNCNQTETYNIEIIVKTGPVSDFSISGLNCLKDTVYFTGISTPGPYNITSYLWNFDDATTQITVNAQKKFATTGNQNVRYRIYADNGCAGDTTKMIFINPTPTAVLGVSTPICASDSVLISDTSTITSGSINSWRYDFGDGNTLVRSTNSNFYHTYALPGNYTIQLITTSNNGCESDTAYKAVTVFAKPVSLFGYTNNICVRDSILISDTSTISIGSIVSWHYDFGDGNTLIRNNSSSFYHTYNTAGSFVLSLVTFSDMSCQSDTFSRTVTVNDRPRSDFSILALNCLNDTIDFNHIPPPGVFNITGYLWNFDDATTQSTIDARKKFATSGVQNIRYRIFTAEGCTGDTTKTITISESPIAKLGVTSMICADSVLVTDTSSIAIGSIISWAYDFGDGNNLVRTVNTPFYHTYTLPGTYNISLVTTSDMGCNSDTSWQMATVTAKPLTDFTFAITNCLRDTVYFTHVVPPGTFNITGYQWDFDDLTTQTTIDAKKKFLTAGVQNVRYRIFTAEGCTGDITKVVNLSPEPVSRLGVTPNGCTNDAILITDTSSISSGSIANWHYDFGDGNTLVRSTNSNFTHTYTAAGTYEVSLVTFSVLGCRSDTVKKTVVIADKPVASFTITGTPCVNNTITFTSAFVPAPGTTWYWDFGDGQTLSTSSGNLATHNYTTTLTNITVKHVVNSGAPCPGDTSFMIIPAINQNPVALFSIVKDTACENIPLLFTSAASGVTNWNWNFGNGSGTNTPPFTRNYSTAGTFNVSLTVTDINNCISQPVSDILMINPTPLVNAGPDKTMNFSGSVLLTASINPAANYTFTWTPAASLNANNILQPTASPQTNTTYLLEAEDVNSHCKASDDVLVTVVTEVYIPNAFTPNGDNKNDRWVIPSMVRYPDAIVTLYNRYGQKIFETKNYINNPWDGTINGKPQQNGTYVYYIALNDKFRQVFQGTVTIIR